MRHEIVIDGNKYVFEELTINDFLDFKKHKKSLGEELDSESEMWEMVAFFISRKVVEPKMTLEEAKNLPIRVALELSSTITEKSGFPRTRELTTLQARR